MRTANRMSRSLLPLRGLSSLAAVVLCGNGTMRLVGRDWGTKEESFSMCDYSLQNVKSRPARVGEKLRTQHFDTGTIGFAAPEDPRRRVAFFREQSLPGAAHAVCLGGKCWYPQSHDGQ